MVTIKVENNQMPLMSLFSPVYTSTRPYSQTKSKTQRPLMFPDDVLHMGNKECLVLLQGEKNLHLYKSSWMTTPASSGSGMCGWPITYPCGGRKCPAG